MSLLIRVSSATRRPRFLPWGVFSWGLLLGACSNGSRATTCELAGTWELTERRVAMEGECQGAPEVQDGVLEIEETSGMFEFRYLQPGMPGLRCAGAPRSDPCVVELTCVGASEDLRREVAFEIHLEAERLSGSRRLQLREPECRATYELTGGEAASS